MLWFLNGKAFKVKMQYVTYTLIQCSVLPFYFVYDTFMDIEIFFFFFSFFTLTTVSFIPANILCNVFFRKFAMWLLYRVYVQMKEEAVVHKDGGLDISPLSPPVDLHLPERSFPTFSPLHKFSIQEPRRRRTQNFTGSGFHGCSCSSARDPTSCLSLRGEVL